MVAVDPGLARGRASWLPRCRNVYSQAPRSPRRGGDCVSRSQDGSAFRAIACSFAPVGDCRERDAMPVLDGRQVRRHRPPNASKEVLTAMMTSGYLETAHNPGKRPVRVQTKRSGRSGSPDCRCPMIALRYAAIPAETADLAWRHALDHAFPTVLRSRFWATSLSTSEERRESRKLFHQAMSTAPSTVRLGKFYSRCLRRIFFFYLRLW